MSESVETCLVCKVAWDPELDPAKCNIDEHPHARNIVADWDVVGRGRGA